MLEDQAELTAWTSVLQFGRILQNMTSTKSVIPAKWRAQLARPASLYGISSWSYTVLGLFVLAQARDCPRSLPGATSHACLPAELEALLVIVQGALSFMADVWNIGRPSLFHCLDRSSAVCLVCAQLLKFGSATLPAGEVLFVWSSLAVSLLCKLMSGRAIAAGSAVSFARVAVCCLLSACRSGHLHNGTSTNTPLFP
jgi:hypothetical protein